MSGTHATFTLEAGAPAADLLTPGHIQRVLALCAGVHTEDLGGLRPVARGRVEVDIAAPRAMGLATPMPLSLLGDDDRPPVVLVLRRPDDPPRSDGLELSITWSGSADAPTAGAIARALSGATGGVIGAEELGVGFGAAEWLSVDVPGHLPLLLRLPATLQLEDGTELVVAATDGRAGP